MNYDEHNILQIIFKTTSILMTNFRLFIFDYCVEFSQKYELLVLSTHIAKKIK